MSLVERVKGLLERCTPGPWRLRDGRDRGMSFWVDSPNCEVENNRGPNYTRQILEDDDYPEKEFDAALIALCPAMAKELVELAGGNERLRADVAEWECLDAEAKHGAEEMTARATAAEKVLAEIAEILDRPIGSADHMEQRLTLISATLTRSTKPEGQE